MIFNLGIIFVIKLIIPDDLNAPIATNKPINKESLGLSKNKKLEPSVSLSDGSIFY